MREELFELLKKYAYKKGEFTLSSGKTSEHYVNCKPVTLTGRGLTLTSLLMIKEVDPDAKSVAGLTLGADPLVSGVSLVSALDSRMVNGLIVRKEPKGHGTEAWVEGLMPEEGTKVTIPDYKTAFQQNTEVKLVVSAINGMMSERGFPLKDLEQMMR